MLVGVGYRVGVHEAGEMEDGGMKRSGYGTSRGWTDGRHLVHGTGWTRLVGTILVDHDANPVGIHTGPFLLFIPKVARGLLLAAAGGPVQREFRIGF